MALKRKSKKAQGEIPCVNDDIHGFYDVRVIKLDGDVLVYYVPVDKDGNRLTPPSRITP